MIRSLYRQIIRNCRKLGWDESRGVPLNVPIERSYPLSDMIQVKYNWDVDWGSGYSCGWIFRDQSCPELHSLLYEIKSGIWYGDKRYLDLLFRITKETGEWQNKPYHPDMYSTLIYSVPFEYEDEYDGCYYNDDYNYDYNHMEYIDDTEKKNI